MMSEYINILIISVFMYLPLVTGRNELLIRRSRETAQCQDKFAILRTHSACQPPSSLVKQSGVSDADIQTIVTEHNKYRSSVQPTASDMNKLSWDKEVAMVAQMWASTCRFNHDNVQDRNIPGRFSLGQNIGRGYMTWKTCIKAWNDEVKDFTYGGNNDFFKVGHFTQLVNSNTTKIGCGLAKCGNTNFHVCNYAPPGNVAGSYNKPYKSGQSCQSCMGRCSDKLCDCSGKACENGGELVLATCTCKCTQAFYINDICQLSCSQNMTEPYMCGTGSYDQTGCHQYSMVPQACPKTCAVCPYGGYNYQEQGNGKPFIHVGHQWTLIITLLTLMFRVYIL